MAVHLLLKSNNSQRVSCRNNQRLVLKVSDSTRITWMLEVDWRQTRKMDSVLYTPNAFSKVSLYGIKKALL